MNHRLNKIREATDLDFQNFDQCVQIYLSFKSLEIDHTLSF